MYTQPSLYHKRTGVTCTSQIKRLISNGAEVHKRPHYKLVDPTTKHISLQKTLICKLQIHDYTKSEQHGPKLHRFSQLVCISKESSIHCKIGNKGPHEQCATKVGLTTQKVRPFKVVTKVTNNYISPLQLFGTLEIETVLVFDFFLASMSFLFPLLFEPCFFNLWY